MPYTFSSEFLRLIEQANPGDEVNPAPWKKVQVGTEVVAGTLRVGSDLWKFWVALRRRDAQVAEQIRASRVAEETGRSRTDREQAGKNLQAIKDVEDAEKHFRYLLQQSFGDVFDYGEWDIREGFKVVTYSPPRRVEW